MWGKPGSDVTGFPSTKAMLEINPELFCLANEITDLKTGLQIIKFYSNFVIWASPKLP